MPALTDDYREQLRLLGQRSGDQPNTLAGVAPTPADAWDYNSQAAQDWLAYQRSLSDQRGLWNSQTGWPTQAGMADAGKQMANALVLGTTAPGFRAFHGSPHSFERFDTANIGTGEGAQAYGHGLYFADREGVARSYKEALKWQGTDWNDPQYVAGFWHNHFGGDADKAATYLQGALKSQSTPEAKQAVQGAIEQLRSGDTGKMTANPGHMYEVNIAANPEHFLDWDKPLSEQSKHVQEALAKVGQFRDKQAGRAIYEQASGATGSSYDAEASARALHSAGIPGIRYLDAGSRAPTQAVTPIRNQLEQARLDLQHWQDSATTPRQEEVRQKSLLAFEKPGSSWADAVAAKQQRVEDLQRSLDDAVQAAKGTHNHVVFDADTIAILRKYGLAGLMAGGAAAGATKAEQ